MSTPLYDINGPCPPGCVRVNLNGKHYWAPVDNLRGEKRSDLTKDQVRRIKDIYRALREVDDTSQRTMLENFSCDANPNREIGMWEAIVKAYKDEMALRPTADLTVRKAVYRVIVVASATGGTVQGVLHAFPAYASLTHLDRAVAALHRHAPIGARFSLVIGGRDDQPPPPIFMPMRETP